MAYANIEDGRMYSRLFYWNHKDYYDMRSRTYGLTIAGKFARYKYRRSEKSKMLRRAQGIRNYYKTREHRLYYMKNYHIRKKIFNTFKSRDIQ